MVGQFQRFEGAENHTNAIRLSVQSQLASTKGNFQFNYADFARLAAATKFAVVGELASLRYAIPTTKSGGAGVSGRIFNRGPIHKAIVCASAVASSSAKKSLTPFADRSSVLALKETSPGRRYIALIRRSQSYWVVDSFVDSGGSQTDN